VSISQEALFKIALKLEDPWYIKLIYFSAEGKQLDVHLDFESGSVWVGSSQRPGSAILAGSSSSFLISNLMQELKKNPVLKSISLVRGMGT